MDTPEFIQRPTNQVISEAPVDRIDPFRYLQPKIFLALIMFFIIGWILNVNMFLTIFCGICGIVYLLLMHSKFLSKYHFISSDCDLAAYIRAKYEGKLLIGCIIVVAAVLLFFSIVTSDTYKSIKLHTTVQNLILTRNVIELNSLFMDEVKSPSNKNLIYIIDQSMRAPDKPLLKSIVSEFGNLSEEIQDSVIKIFAGSKLSIYSADYIATRLLVSGFQLNKPESKVAATFRKSDLEIEVSKQLKTILSSEAFVEIDIREMNRVIQLLREYFNTPNDSLWSDMQAKLIEIDTLKEFLKKTKTTLPDKPIMYRPTFYGPQHLTGYVMPFDGDGVLVINYPKLFVIEGLEKDMSAYFEGYVIKTGRTTGVYSKATGATWDATIYEYVSQREYDESVSSFKEEQAEAALNYNRELKIYNTELTEYNSYKKNLPLIEAKISNLLGEIKISFNQLSEKI